MTGGMAVAYPVEEERIESVQWRGEQLRVETTVDTYLLDVERGEGGDTMISEYDLMELVLGDPEALAQHWNDDRWRVRYAAAVAMGETGDPRWLPELHRLLVIEDGRDLYSQPRVMGFVGSFDDTRMAEQLIRTEAIFDREYSPEALDAWALPRSGEAGLPVGGAHDRRGQR